MVTFDATDATSRLDAITEQVEECRAAIQLAEEGDPTALEPMLGAIDTMAEHIAVLRSAVSGPPAA
ncbi:MAG: hypothetical protein JWO90_509 [Solirubrobacterales bacterium]|jgi:hypothetical protein|nr:hypothetical protein [Solirubrobacterales bacterium]